MDYIFQGFPHSASAIKKYFYNFSYFMLMLHDGQIISFTPENADAFLEWLKKNNIPDIRDIEGY